MVVRFVNGCDKKGAKSLYQCRVPLTPSFLTMPNPKCPKLISSYLDKIMVPFVKSLPSHIKDTNYALKIFRDFTFSGENKFIFTMDITSLYTVIPNNEGLLAFKFYFDQRSTKEPSSETLLRRAELVLTLNCFSFSNNHYQHGMVSPWALKWDLAMPISS